MYSTELVKYDSSTQEVQIRSEEELITLKYKECLVMTTGPYTPDFRVDPKAEVIEV